MMTGPFARRPSRKGRPPGAWSTARKLVQAAALLLFVALFVASRQGSWPASLVNFPMRLDALAVLANLLASRAFLAGSALALLLVLFSLVFGRAWCGWLCPLGTLLDLFPLERWRAKRPAPPEGWRGLKYGLLLTLLVAALLGNLTLLALDPLTLLFRTLTAGLWPALDQAVTAVETVLYPIPALSAPVAAFDAWVRPVFLPAEPLFYRDALLFAGIFLGVIALNLFAPRFWCRYVCPLGGLLGVIGKFALFRREVGAECKGCTLCTAACPTGTIDPAKAYASDPGECTLCLDCLEACPRGLTAFKPGLHVAAWKAYDPERRKVLLAVGVAAAGLALSRSGALAKREPPHLLRPPGAREANPDALSLTHCVRCGECLRACPTGGLQPAVFEAGLAGFGTPLLAPRLGYCDYACNACGQVCPAQAIPPLSLEEKRLQVIGRASIDQNRCIAWSEHLPCIVCEEMCPLPEKAIQLEVAEVWTPGGASVELQLPHVVRERCIGCGICEYKCPVNGESAIRVYTPETAVPF